MDKRYFAGEIGKLCLLFGKESSPELLKLLWAEFQNVEQPAFAAAVDHILRNNQRFPVPKDFYDALEGSGKVKAYEAWKVVMSAIGAPDMRGGKYNGTYGRDHKPTFHDDATNEALEMAGGWYRLCNLHDSELKWFKKEFLDAYSQTAAKPTEKHLRVVNDAGLLE